MYARHDLAWLTAEGWQHLLAATPPGTPAHAALARWRDADWPLIVRRRDEAACGRAVAAPDAAFAAAGATGDANGGHEAMVCLGLAAPPDLASGARLRLPIRVPTRHVARSSAPQPLAAVAHAVPAHWRAAFAQLCESSTALDLRVFGSLALQALTGQAYLRDSSDIDLLFRPRSLDELDAGTVLLASQLEHLPLDGEILFPSGQAVAWKEWFTARADTGRVLVKAQASVKLATRAELRAELEPA
jgi:phosphoribosyl-dephospho-CoA transferase